MSLTKKVTGGVAWLTVAQVIRRGSGLIITAILARLLSPEDFGLIALVSIAVNVVSIFGDAGIGSALVQRAEVSDDHLTTAFWLSNIFSIALAFLGVVLAYPFALFFKEPRIVPLLMVMMLVLPLNALGMVSDVILQRRLEFRRMATIEWMSSLIAGFLGVALALGGAGVWALIAQTIAVSIVSTCSKLYATQWAPSFTFSIEHARNLLSFSVSVIGCAVINFVGSNVDNMIIGGALGVKALGYYTIAYSLVLMPGASIGGMISRVMFPALASLQNDMARLRYGYLRMLRLVASATFPLIFGLGAVAPLFVKTIYGEQWNQVIPLLQVLVVIGIFQAINTCGVVFYAVGRPNVMLLYALLSTSIMAVGFAIGVRWGTIGVAWAYVAVSPLIWIVPHLMANRLIELPNKSFLRAIAPPLFAGMIMFSLVMLLDVQRLGLVSLPWLNLMISILEGAAIYIVGLIAIGISRGQWRDNLIPWLMGKHLLERTNP